MTLGLGGGLKGISPHPVSNGTLKGSSELHTVSQADGDES